MEDCELCGRKTNDVYILNIENVEMHACARCAKGKKVIRVEKEAKQKAKAIMPTRSNAKPEDEQLVEDYAKVIREAREQMKLPIKVLAELINEKENLILRVEEGRTLPSITLTKKLEKALKIKLTAAEEEPVKVATKKPESATVGDFFQK
ncbi:MAG: multiprotein bridging factor aMBF1 [Candidatus Marsarchaeota archaeon]|nr:multiprotein bridging factor aMBF1 [Candidatus Marsarchaeota archaeon]